MSLLQGEYECQVTAIGEAGRKLTFPLASLVILPEDTTE